MDEFSMSRKDTSVEEALAQIDGFPGIAQRQKNCLRLLAEEMFSMMEKVLNHREATFKMAYDGEEYSLSIIVKANISEKDKETFMGISSDGKNTAYKGIFGKMSALIEMLAGEASYCPVEGFAVNADLTMTHTYSWSMAQYFADNEDKEDDWDGMEKSIIVNFADDVLIGVSNEKLEMTVKKKF